MSCLFNSLAPTVNLHPQVLRKLIVSYLRTNPKLMDSITAEDIVLWTEEINLQTYANNMESNNAWGGAIEIRAFCELFCMDVNINVLYTKSQFKIQTSKKSKGTVWISYTGNHFEFIKITRNI